MDRLWPTVAEQSVLGGIFYKNSLVEEVNLTHEDFHLAQHAWVFRAMQALYAANKPIDELTVEYELSQRPNWHLDSTLLEKAGGIAFIAQLAQICPNKDNTLYYADIVREASNLRRLRQFAGDLSNRIERGDSSEAVLDLLRNRIEAVDGETGASNTLADVETGTSSGLPTGLGIEKFVPGGLPCDKITTIFAESGHGKSTLKNAIMFHLARSGHKVLDVSLEDSSNLTVARYLAQKHGMPYGQLAAGTMPVPPMDDEDRSILGNIVDGSRCSPRMVDLIKLARREQVSAVFVDYVQLLDGCSGDHVTLAESVREAQLAAKNDGIAYVLVSQVKQDPSVRANQRDAQGRLVGDPRPTVADCLGSSSLRTGAKLGIGLFYPYKYAPIPRHETGPFGAYCRFINNFPGGVDAACEVYQSLVEIIIDKNVLGQSKVCVHAKVDWKSGKMLPYEFA